MGDLKDPRWMYLKAALFVAIGFTSSLLLLLDSPRLKTLCFLALAIWSFARAYYFAFYVIHHYIDPYYHFDGLLSALRFVWKNRSKSRVGDTQGMD